MAGAFEIVMAERKALVEKIISMMKQGDFFHNASEWDRAALRPQNPFSKVWYRGGNRIPASRRASKGNGGNSWQSRAGTAQFTLDLPAKQKYLLRQNRGKN